MPKKKSLDRLGPWLDEWPADDRRALEHALRPSDGCEFFEDEHAIEGGRATSWSEDYLFHNVAGNTYWVRFNRQRDQLVPGETPYDRATRKRLNAYVKSLSHVSAYARLTYVRAISNILRVTSPNGSPPYLRRLVRHLDREAEPSRDQRHLLVPPSDMFYGGIERMKRVMNTSAISLDAAMQYCDGLIMSAIVCKALRKKNFVGMLRDRNIKKNVMDVYEVNFEPAETKAHRRIRADLSALLTHTYALSSGQICG